MISLQPIGHLQSALRDLTLAPRQGAEGAPDAWLDVDPAFERALLGVAPGEEVIVVTWLHEADRHVLQVHPRGDPENPIAGVFMTRSPNRPNPIGLHRVTVREISGTRLRRGVAGGRLCDTAEHGGLVMTGAGHSSRTHRRVVGLALLCAAALPAVPLATPAQSAKRSMAVAVAPLGPCGPHRPAAYASAECGAIRVFENRRTKQGRTIDVAFARWRAETQPAAGTVFFLAGGPGAGGGSVADSVHGWASPLRATLDLVVVDQRGTWFSNALHCARDIEARPAAAFGHIFDPDWVRECRRVLERTADLRFYSTELAAEDLDDVRAELGYERIGVYGGSYGTRLAQAYMRRYPDRTRAVVLDAAMPFDVKVPLTYAATAQGALDHLSKSHPNLQAEFARVLDRFQAGPIRTSVNPPGQSPVPVPMSRGDFGYAVRGILYRPDQLNQLPGWISRAAATGDMTTFAQRYWERALTFSRTFATGLHFSILCSEDVAFIGENEIDAAAARTFLGRFVIDEYRNACALWPVIPASAEFRKPVASAVPTLLLSGAYDPVTPPAFADRIATSLTNARHLVSRTNAHGSVGGCARSAAVHVLKTGTLTGMPDDCR